MVKPYEVPGFYPTSERVGRIMIEAAKLETGMTLLEPSAGDGALLDLMPDTIWIRCYETDPTLQRILYKKGYKPGGDFTRCIIPENSFDRVIMNPPFEFKQHLHHIDRATRFLKPDGILVSLIPRAENMIRKDITRIQIEPGSGNKKGSLLVDMIIIVKGGNFTV